MKNIMESILQVANSIQYSMKVTVDYTTRYPNNILYVHDTELCSKTVNNNTSIPITWNI